MSAAIHSEAIPRDRSYVIEICRAGESRLPQHEPDPTWHAHIRNTAQITVLKASEKTNVVPAEATAEVDIRILPGQDPETFMPWYREAGIVTYGIDPFLVDRAEHFRGHHGNDERLSVDNLRNGIRFIYDILHNLN
jgi:acetylornithine deacetylase/succinyl-diaminopimelate desuccinylase-like protein